MRRTRQHHQDFINSSDHDLDLVSLRIDERVDEQNESSENVRVEFEVETCKGSNSNEFDVTERFSELGLGVEEPELSEELIRTNSQAQEDELLAMEYIYPDNVTKLDTHRGLQSFEVHINIEVPDGITVSTKLDSSSDEKATGNKSMEDFAYSFQVQYLPPMVLTCLLPNSYPSHQPPYFTLSVQWLDPKRTSGLCSMLDSIWMEQSGQEIIYHWVEWLSSTSLSYLGFEKEIILCPYGDRHIEDRRAAFESVSPDAVIPLIKRYNDEMLYKNFQLISHECCICYNEYPGSEFARLPCQHFFCLKCMKTFCDMHIKEGTVMKLQCPEAKCEGLIPPSLLKRILSQEEYERWESLTLQKSLDSMVDVMNCPRCATPCIKDADRHAQCTSCFFSFCTLCRGRRHVGEECYSAEKKLKILQDRQNWTLLGEIQKLKEKELIDELTSIKAILGDSKLCPHCNMAIFKTAGCNFMRCKNCGKDFCYSCNKTMRGHRNHTCELSTQATIQELEEDASPEPSAEQGPGLICPTCGKFNVKVGIDNHVFCSQCQVHHCYLCKKFVWRSDQHYNVNACKKYTVG